MSLVVPSRRLFLRGMMSLVAAPLVVPSGVLMPISSRNLPMLRHIHVAGPDAGSIDAIAGTAPRWMIPCDGRLVNGREFPDLFAAVRGRAPEHDDEWVQVFHDPDDFPSNATAPTIDRFVSMSYDAILEEMLNG